MSEQLNTMNEQLITAGEAAEVLNTTLEDIPSFYCRFVRYFNFFLYICTAFENNMKVTI